MDILQDCLATFDETTQRMRSSELYEKLNFPDASNGSVYSKGKWLVKWLKGWNIKPRTMRFPDGTTAKGYLKAQFQWALKTGRPLPPDF